MVTLHHFNIGDEVVLAVTKDADYTFTTAPGSKARVRYVQGPWVFVVWDKPCLQADGGYRPQCFRPFLEEGPW